MSSCPSSSTTSSGGCSASSSGSSTNARTAPTRACSTSSRARFADYARKCCAFSGGPKTVRRVAVVVAPERAEDARARVLELFPEGFEEVELPDGVELAVYTDTDGERALLGAFPGGDAVDV